MNILTLQSIAKRYGDQSLFESITFGMSEGEKIGLIGRNGEGKSTLVRILCGTEEPDSGEVTWRRDLRIATMEQTLDFTPETTIESYLAAALDHPEASGAVREALSFVGDEAPERRLSELSGGQMRRVALARALLADADLLILDEPTNHLDLDAILALEKRLKRFRGALLLITHDRYFLERVIGTIIELEGGELKRYSGRYSDYLEARAMRDEQARREEHKLQRYLAKELEWMRRQPKARSTRQKARAGRFEEASEQPKLRERGELKFESDSSRLGNRVLELHRVGAVQPGVAEEAAAILFSDLTYNFKKEDRIGILGANGCGKSTLLEILAGRREPSSGRAERGETLRIGYFDQLSRQFDPSMQVRDYLLGEVGEQAVGSGGSLGELLEAFLFHGSVLYRSIARLSGGERRRLYLISVLLRNPNFLLLDEPTNDFDIATLTALESFVDSFAGPVVIVSHDRWFLDRTASSLFLFGVDQQGRESRGEISFYTGRASDYLEERRERRENRAVEPKGQRSGSAAMSESGSKESAPKRLGFMEKRELTELPSKIESLEAGIAELEQSLASGESDPERLAMWGKRHGELTAEHEAALSRWMELEERSTL